MQKVPLAAEETGTLIGGVPRHLQHPFATGMFGQTGKADPAPQPEFSLAKRTMSASTAGPMWGRPGEVRNLEPSN